MKSKFRSSFSLIVIVCMLLLPLWASAQGGPGGDVPDDPGVPIDGGVSLLVGAAVLYGTRKFKGRKNNEK